MSRAAVSNDSINSWSDLASLVEHCADGKWIFRGECSSSYVFQQPTQPFEPRSLSRWVVTSGACSDIERILDACAINESSLFPDIDGLSRYLGWRYKWGKL